MAIERLRQRIAWEAARLLYRRQESEYFRARLKAAKRVSAEPVRAQDLPTRREIREQIEVFARMCEDERRQQEIDGEGPWALNGAAATQAPPSGQAAEIDRFHAYRMLLVPLEQVKQKPQTHPEGDALYHSLQVFDLAREHLPYDEEFLLAALLHDVGKALDPQDHVAAALEALDGHITPRTAWLIEHHSEANALREGTLGVRSRRRLEESPDFDELMLLSRCDREGRRIGVTTPDVDDALAYLRELAASCGE